MPRSKARPRTRSLVRRRWLGLGALALVALLYYQPLRAYISARSQQAAQAATVHRLQEEKATLERRLKRSSSDAVLAAEARLLGYVRPGERLYIVKNLPEWRRKQHPSRRDRKQR
jgi:cell division protein FtsB